jgi:hypothetical protein
MEYLKDKLFLMHLDLYTARKNAEKRNDSEALESLKTHYPIIFQAEQENVYNIFIHSEQVVLAKAIHELVKDYESKQNSLQ